MSEFWEKFKKTEQTRITVLSNKDLLDETLKLATGDTYEGHFTKKGEVTFELLEHELYQRLKDWFDE